MITQFRGEYMFLSNFYEAPVTYKGETYPSSEAAFQAQKTLNPVNRELFKSLKPQQAKKYGKQVPLRNDWQEVKLEVMLGIVYNKFTQNKDLKEQLLATGDTYLVEGNNWRDTYWGVYNGKGTNYLGRILMHVRKLIKNNEPLGFES